jgi:hypothetical protein
MNRFMRSKLFVVAGICFICAVAVAQQNSEGIPHEPKTIITVPSPDKRIVAIARSPIPDVSVPDYQDADGTLVFIGGPNRGDRIIAHRFFSGRFISRMMWSPDSQFLVLSSKARAVIRLGTSTPISGVEMTASFAPLISAQGP